MMLWVQTRDAGCEKRIAPLLASKNPQNELFPAVIFGFLGLPQNRRGLAHFAESAEQNVPVPLSADDFGIGS
jgi:hypothetical protein